MRGYRIVFVALALGVIPRVAMAEGKMPQMDFADPLTGAQIVWMAIILIALYFLMARWALPQIGAVIETRLNHIAADLETARLAKAKAEHAVAELNGAIHNAREEGQIAIAHAVRAAKDRARAQSLDLNIQLDAQIAKAEEDINTARVLAISSLPDVAREVTASLLLRLTGEQADPARIDGALAKHSF